MSRGADKTPGQVIGLLRYATKHGGLTLPEIKTILCLSADKTTAALRNLSDRGLVQLRPNGAWVASPGGKIAPR